MIHTDIFFWGWLILAIVFFVGELMTAGFFLMAFGVGAAVAAIIALLGLSLVWQLVVFIVISSLIVVSLRRFADRISRPEKVIQVGIDRVMGKTAIVTEPIDPINETGIVRVDAEEWRAIPANGHQIIPERSLVKVLSVEGTRLVVEAIKPPSESEKDP